MQAQLIYRCLLQWRRDNVSLSEPSFPGLISLFRFSLVVIAAATLASCNDLSGDQNGGVIENPVIHLEPGPLDAYLPQWILNLRDRYTLRQDDLRRLAEDHAASMVESPNFSTRLRRT